MPRRGRPKKQTNLYTFRNLVEFTSDTDSDSQNVRENISYDVGQPKVRRAEQHPRRQLQRPIHPRRPELQQEEDPRPQIQRPADQLEQQHVRPIHPRRPELQQEEDPHPHHAEHQPPLPRPAEQQEQHPRPQPPLPRAAEQQEQDPEPQLRRPQLQPPEEQQRPPPEQQPIPATREVDDTGTDNDDEVEDEYTTNLEKFKSMWMVTEIQHCVSKTATDAFWKLGLQYFPQLSAAQNREHRKKINQFKTIRRHFYKDRIPPIDIKIGFRNRTSGEIVIVNDTVTPIKRFNNKEYEKVYEIGTVKVTYIYNIYLYLSKPTILQ